MNPTPPQVGEAEAVALSAALAAALRALHHCTGPGGGGGGGGGGVMHHDVAARNLVRAPADPTALQFIDFGCSQPRSPHLLPSPSHVLL